jgi:hypothetical protein
MIHRLLDYREKLSKNLEAGKKDNEMMLNDQIVNDRGEQC